MNWEQILLKVRLKDAITALELECTRATNYLNAFEEKDPLRDGVARNNRRFDQASKIVFLIDKYLEQFVV